MLTGVAPKRSTSVCCSVCSVTLSPCCCCCGCCCLLRCSNDGFGFSWKKSLLSVFLRGWCDGGAALRSPVASFANGSGVSAEVVAAGAAVATNGLPGDGDQTPPTRAGTVGVSVGRRTLLFGCDGEVVRTYTNQCITSVNISTNYNPRINLYQNLNKKLSYCCDSRSYWMQ